SAAASASSATEAAMARLEWRRNPGARYPMRIRTQLVILVLAVMAPVALLAALASVGLWEMQRESYAQRIQERVSALRIALDTELEATLRTLRTLSESPVLDLAAPSEDMTHTFQRMLRNNPSWATIGLASRDAVVRSRLDRRAELEAAKPQAQWIADVLARSEPPVSNLVSVDNGAAYVTFAAVPVLRQGEAEAVLFIGIEHTAWLDFFRRY